MSLGRRALLKLLPGASIGAGAAVRAAAEALGGVAATGPALVPNAAEGAALGASGGGNKHPLWPALRAAEIDEDVHRTIASGRMDPDIAALRSVSPAIKHFMQAQRLRDRCTWHDRLRMKVWG